MAKRYLNYYYPVSAVVNIFFMISCFIVGYWPVLERLKIRWDSGDSSYSYLVIPLFLYLCWERNSFFRFDRFAWSALGPIVVFLSSFVAVVGELGSIETFQFIGIWGSITGILITLYGKKCIYLFFPLLILAFIVPLPPYINRNLTLQLKILASSLSSVFLNLSGFSVFTDGNLIDLGKVQLQVADACSGLRYVMPVLIMGLLFGHFCSLNLWRRIYLLFISVLVTIFINAVRIWLTGILMLNDLQQYAEGAYHDAIGLLLYILSAIMLYFVASSMRPGGERGKAHSSFSVQKRGTVKAIIVCSITCGFFLSTSGALSYLHMERDFSLPRKEFSLFPMQLGQWSGQPHYYSQKILDSLWADDYVSATFSRPDSTNVIHLFVPYYRYQGTRHTAHAPRSCLLGSGWAITHTQQRTISVNNGQKELPVMTMELKRGRETMLSGYFFVGRGRVVTSPWMNKLYLFIDSVKNKRTDGALVRVEMILSFGQTAEAGFLEMSQFMSVLWQELPLYVPGKS